LAVAANDVAVAFASWGTFSSALTALQRLYALACAPFTLYVVDSGWPAPVQQVLDEFLQTKDNVVRIGADRFLYPSEALNLIAGRVREPKILVLHNDILIGRGALARLSRSMDDLGADVVVPTVLDLERGIPAQHRDADEAVAFVDREAKIHGVPETTPRWRQGCRQVDFFEFHCFLVRADALRAVLPLPPLNVHEHVDLSIALWRLSKTTFLETRARVLYAGSPPLPLREFERRYFAFRWDPERAKQSDVYVRNKWHIAKLYDAMNFIEHQQRALAPEAVLVRYDSVFAADEWPEELPPA
jgi:GT2 family glycosyltransferase